MPIKLETIKPGDVLWEKKREFAGNTTMRRWAIRPVKVIEVHGSTATVSWNGNPPRVWSARGLCKLYRKKPEARKSALDA